MSKIICDICGTSYPESSTQCPICGCVRPAEAVSVEESDEKTGGYTYVKGGRFSKSNVKKRNQGVALKYLSDEDLEKEPVNKRNIILVIVLICLIFVVCLFFGLIFLLGLGAGNDNDTEPPVVTVAPVEDTNPSEPEVTETEPVATTEPEPTETEPEAYVKLDREYIDEANDDTFSWPLYVEGSVPATEINWVSEDTKVATVDAEGTVYAVGEGTTVIRAEYQGKVLATCTIVCKFNQTVDPSLEGGEPGNEEFDDDKKLCTKFGAVPFEDHNKAYSVTMAKGEAFLKFFLMRTDGTDGIEYIKWTVVEGDCNIDSDGIGVSPASNENCKLKTVINNKTYYLIIRIG